MSSVEAVRILSRASQSQRYPFRLEEGSGLERNWPEKTTYRTHPQARRRTKQSRSVRRATDAPPCPALETGLRWTTYVDPALLYLLFGRGYSTREDAHVEEGDERERERELQKKQLNIMCVVCRCSGTGLVLRKKGTTHLFDTVIKDVGVDTQKSLPTPSFFFTLANSIYSASSSPLSQASAPSLLPYQPISQEPTDCAEYTT